MMKNVRAVIFLHFGNVGNFDVLNTIQDMIIPESLFLVCFFESIVPASVRRLVEDHNLDVADANSRRFHLISGTSKTSSKSLMMQHLESMHSILPETTTFFCVADSVFEYPHKLLQMMSDRPVVLGVFGNYDRNENEAPICGDKIIVYDLHKAFLDLCIEKEHVHLFRGTMDNLIASFKQLPVGAKFNHSTFVDIDLLKSLPFSPLLLLNSLLRMKILIRDRDSLTFNLSKSNIGLHYQHKYPGTTGTETLPMTNELTKPRSSRTKLSSFYDKLLAFMVKNESEFKNDSIPDSEYEARDTYSHFAEQLDEEEESIDLHFNGEQHFLDLLVNKYHPSNTPNIDKLDEFVRYHFPGTEVLFDDRESFDPITGESEGFKSRLTVDDESFEASSAEPTVKLAQEQSSKFAMKYFDEYINCALKTGALKKGEPLANFLTDDFTAIITESTGENHKLNFEDTSLEVDMAEIDTTAMPLFNEYLMKCGSTVPEFTFKSSLDGIFAGNIQLYGRTFNTTKIHKKKTDVKNDIAAQVLTLLGKKLRADRQLSFSGADLD